MTRRYLTLRDIAALTAEALGEAVVTAYWNADRARQRCAAWWSPDREVCRWVRDTSEGDE
jgi:hypothetical protein